jgi:hypothetical protein
VVDFWVELMKEYIGTKRLRGGKEDKEFIAQTFELQMSGRMDRPKQEYKPKK